MFEGWSGSGVPAKLRGEAIAPIARVATIADAVVPAYRVGGAGAIREVARLRGGRAFDPALASLVEDHADALAEVLAVGSPAPALHELALGAEPPAAEPQIDALCESLADFTDLAKQSTFRI